MSHTRLVPSVASVGISVVLILGARGSAAPPPDPQKIDAAIAKARQWIYSQQHEGGHWEKDSSRQGDSHAQYISMQGDTFGGYTALATYALLASGESPNDPRVRAAVDFLKSADPVGIYAIAMRCQVWLLIPHQSAEMRELIRKDAQALFDGINDGSKNPRNKGLWDYLGQGARVDHSVSQYGVLGLWACQQAEAGIDVGTARWLMFENAWRRQQHPDGGWDYGDTSDETVSMTAAGVATLFIVADYLHAQEAVACNGNVIDPALDRGLAWLDKHFNQVGDDAYAMYGIERIGAASGYRYFAKRDWYKELSARLLETQNKDGSWTNATYTGAQPLDNTCFAVLFLARGQAPVMASKLDYHAFSPAATQPIPFNWNERPRDMANLAAWIGHATEKLMQWQIVNLMVAPEDMHDAPLLYLSGNEDIPLDARQAAKIKTFIQEGGMVLGNADCGREMFSKSFVELGRRLFGTEFRELPADHVMFTHEQFAGSRWRNRPRVLGLSNGVRELMVLIPKDDPARWWQVPRGGDDAEPAYELGADIYQYSCDRQQWNKGSSHWVQANPSVKPTRKLRVARLQVGANWDPEPGGWWRMTNILHNQDDVQITVYAAKPGAGALTPAQVAHLTGTTGFELSDPPRLEIQTFVKNGGTLVVDAAGGSVAFADAAEREVQKMFGPAAPLPSSDRVYNLPRQKMAGFAYRPWARLRVVGASKAPRLRGIKVADRTAVFLSREDLSAGLVGEPVDGIIGYAPQSATDIMRNILLYSLEAKKKAAGPTSRPTTAP